MSVHLLPQPSTCTWAQGSYHLPENIEIVLGHTCDRMITGHARLLKQEIEKTSGTYATVSKAFDARGDIWIAIGSEADEEYTLEISQDGIRLTAGDAKGVWNGIQTLRQLLRQCANSLPCVRIEDKPVFKHRGYYYDVTRGKIPKLETLFRLIDLASGYKINQFQLYIEHTFAYRGHEEIWAGHEPLTPEDILALDEYCRERHVELVPSFSVFGHLYHMLRSDTYQHLCELGADQTPFSWDNRMHHHTLAVSNPESFDVVAQMLDQVMPLFSSNLVNICADETFDLGQGQSKALAEDVGKGKVYADFLSKLIGHVKKHGKRAMFWGDIILKYPEYLPLLPQEAVCLNWHYGAIVTDENVRTIAESGIEQYVCPGVGGWNRIMNSIQSSFLNIRGMVECGQRHQASGVLNTDWGDFGHVNQTSGSVPGLIFGAALSWNPQCGLDDDGMMKAISVVEYGDTSGTMVSLLRDMGLCELLNWRFLALLRDYHENGILQDNYEGAKAEVAAISPDQWRQADEKLEAIRRSIQALLPIVTADRRQDVQEFLIAVEGIVLLNHASAFLASGYGKETVHLLPEKIEKWLERYSRAWRICNRESELSRINEAIRYICHSLRTA